MLIVDRFRLENGIYDLLLMLAALIFIAAVVIDLWALRQPGGWGRRRNANPYGTRLSAKVGFLPY